MKRKHMYLVVVLGLILTSCLSAFAEEKTKHVVVIPESQKTGRDVASESDGRCDPARNPECSWVPGVTKKWVDGNLVQLIDTTNKVVCYYGYNGGNHQISCVSVK